MNLRHIVIILTALTTLGACTNYEIVPPDSVHALPATQGTTVAIKAHELSLDKDTAFTSGGFVQTDIAGIGKGCGIGGGRITIIHKIRPARICPWDIYLDKGEFSIAIRNAFINANYTVVQNSPQVLVSPTITRISYTGRHFTRGKNTYGRAGTAIRVEWRVQKTMGGPIIYIATYDARTTIETAIDNPGSFIRIAMINSVERLLADPKFHKLANSR
jgi:hypothetical protein